MVDCPISTSSRGLIALFGNVQKRLLTFVKRKSIVAEQVCLKRPQSEPQRSTAMDSSSRSTALPCHEDGDVEIHLSRKPEDRFVVHSVGLSLHSSFFKASLSSRWASGNRGSPDEGTIKWKYQLRFDELDGGSTDHLDLLARATAGAVHVAETPGLHFSTAAIFTRCAPWVPQDNNKTSFRTYTTEAHRQYLKLIHHIPLAIDPSNFEYVVKSIYTLVRVADAYDSLSVVSMPVENYLIRYHSSDIERFSNANYKELLNIAMKIHSRWLLKEIVSRIIADPLWEDHDIERNFSSFEAGELLLSKRAELRDMLKDIHQRVVLIEQPRKTGRMPDERTITFATAAFRDEISRLFRSHRNGGSVSYARKFRLLKERLLRNIGSEIQYPSHPYWFDRLYDKFGEPANISREDFGTVFQSLQHRTAEIIEPFFGCVVKQPSAKLSKRNASYQGFLCINVTDDELPW
ncbi:hypothetical protein HO133_003315 [Letharia lupina]|uniref:BTB domain-containing protein n=1 Tax=Letharia lupina TaxID=560253 RepID=A0A8H6CB59_9LECA|nr:uncharacterized protein HO133_003315 [Letharia lupina]KAF6220184.1 hypothetical protein HO133_003315 [Letharia lupina]